MPNLQKLNYTSQYPIDKIVQQDVTGTLSYSQTTGGDTTHSMPNTYKKNGFVTLSWSIDGTNYYPAQAYTSPSAPYTANGWCDNDNIYIFVENYSGSTQTFTIKLTLDTIE